MQSLACTRMRNCSYCGEDRGYVPSKSCSKMLFQTVLCCNLDGYVWDDVRIGPHAAKPQSSNSRWADRTDVHTTKEILSPFKNCPSCALAKIIRTARTPSETLIDSFDLQYDHGQLLRQEGRRVAVRLLTVRPATQDRQSMRSTVQFKSPRVYNKVITIT